MRSSPTHDFIEQILTDRAPSGFNANRSDADVLRVAIALRASRPDPVGPDQRFVDDLHHQLAAAARQPDGLPSSIATRPDREASRALTPAFLPSRRARRVPRRYAMVGKAAAALLLVGATVGTTTILEAGSSAPLAQTAAGNTGVRSGELLSASGRLVGRMYAYKGQSSWLFMNVHADNLTGVYTCEVQLANGTTLRIGTLTLRDGSGVYAHIVNIDIAQLRAGKLVAPNGATLATANLS
jgi:hypothetical protein